MKITEVVVHRVNITLDTPYRWALGTYPGGSKGIVEVHTDEGVTGLGELAEVGLAGLVEDGQAPRLIGADPMDLERCFRLCVPEFMALSNVMGVESVRAFGGIEMALWDIKGKALGVPVYTLLGGAARTSVAFSEYFAYRELTGGIGGELSPVDVARYCARMREEHGSTIFEGKIGIGDLDTQIDVVRQIRSAIGDDATLRLDVNMSWPLNTARRALRLLEPFDIANIEEPVASFRDMAKLRQHSPIPFSSHLPDIRLAAELGVPETIVLNVTNLGGIRETVKFINACETFGVGFWCYSGDAGVATAAYLHLSAALPYLEQPHQSLLRWYVDDVIAEGPFRPERNVVQVPEGPGLGVTLDPAGLERCKQRFNDHGPISVFSRPGETAYGRLARQ